MSASYDTLGFAQHLISAGMRKEHANAVTEAIRDKVMPELATRTDIAEVKNLIVQESLRTRLWLGATVVAATVTTVGVVSAIVKFA